MVSLDLKLKINYQSDNVEMQVEKIRLNVQRIFFSIDDIDHESTSYQSSIFGPSINLCLTLASVFIIKANKELSDDCSLAFHSDFLLTH